MRRRAKTNVRMIMSEKLESFARKAEPKAAMTNQNILRDARILKNVVMKESSVNEDMDRRAAAAEDSDAEGSEHRSFSRTGNDLIETDDELVEVGSPERAEDSDEEDEGPHFSSRPLDFTTGRRMSDESSEGEGDEYFR